MDSISHNDGSVIVYNEGAQGRQVDFVISFDKVTVMDKDGNLTPLSDFFKEEE